MRLINSGFSNFRYRLTQTGAAAVLLLSLSYGVSAHADPASAAAASPAVAGAASRTASQAIVVLGDSISAGYGIQREQGWVHLLDKTLDELGQAWSVVNASISGETTGGGLARMRGVLETHAPAIVIIELGGNDGLRGYPVAGIRDNLTAMANMARSYGALPMIVGMRIPPNYGARYTQAFDGVFAEVASATDAQLVPFLMSEVALADNLMQNDGIHPTAAAQPLLLDAVWSYLQPLL